NRNASACIEPFVTITCSGPTPCEAAIHSRSGSYPTEVPYPNVRAGSLVKAASAAAFNPSTSKMSREGAPRANEMGVGSTDMLAIVVKCRISAFPAVPLERDRSISVVGSRIPPQYVRNGLLLGECLHRLRRMRALHPDHSRRFAPLRDRAVHPPGPH